MNIPYQIGRNDSTWSRSNIQNTISGIRTLNAIVYANIQNMSLSDNHAAEVGFINNIDGYKNPEVNGLDNITLGGDTRYSILEQGNISCYEIRYYVFAIIYT